MPIPKGVSQRNYCIIHGEGDEELGAVPGDLKIRFTIQERTKYIERKGSDLYLEKSITLLEALTGFVFAIKHLDGRVIKIATMPGEIISN